MNEKEKEAAKQSLVERTMKLHDEIADLGNMPFTTESRRAYQAGLEQGFDAGYNAHSSGWVRVSDRLPEPGFYLVTRSNGYVNEDCLAGGEWSGVVYYGKAPVVAWMEKPEPFTE